MRPQFILSLVAIWALSFTHATAYTYTARQLNVRSTAYTHSENPEWGKTAASGKVLQFSREYTSAAADWSWLPLGTEFRIKGINRHFVIDDYGSGLVGKKTVDLYFPTASMMERWGMRNVDIIITKYGDFEESERVLSAHLKYTDNWYVKTMLTNIQNKAIQNAGTDPYFEPMPPLVTEIDKELMAAASIPKWQWLRKAPAIESDSRQTQLTVVSKLNDKVSSEIVEPPFPDQAEWEGDPFVVVYAAPIVEPVLKVTPIKPISELESFYYEERPQTRAYRILEKRFE